MWSLLVPLLLSCNPSNRELPGGAPDAGTNKPHWAYAAPVRQQPTTAFVAETRAFARNAIDSFVLAKYAEKNLSPARAADRRTLMRRLSWDLLGLPPSPQQVEEFVHDDRPNAYERVVDRMLAAPQFGERMAMYWLDLVRYGDTNGYHADVHRNVFPYRDYVIRAFNSNKRFNEFTVEQLAGDLLPNATVEQSVASGYNRMNMITTEGGAQAKEYLAKYAADRVRNASVVWMASTLGCSECHDHKFDPFTTRDFYSFAAFFADVKQVGVYPNTVDLDPQLKVPTAAQASELRRLDERIASLQKTIDTQTPELETAQADWVRSLENAPITWSVLRPASLASHTGSTFTVREDRTVVAGGDRPETDTYTMTFADAHAISAIRIDVLPEEGLPGHGPGRADNGNFVLSQLSAEVIDATGGAPHALGLQNASASYEQKGGSLGVAGAIDPAKRSAKSGWAIGEQFGKASFAVFELREPIGESAVTLRLTLEQNHGTKHTMGSFRISATAARPVSATSTLIQGVPDSIANIVRMAPDDRSGEQKGTLSAFFRSVTPLLEAPRRELAEAKQQRDSLDKSIPLTLHTVAVEPPMMRVLPRGNWLDDSGDVVQPAVPHFLPQPALDADTPAACTDGASGPEGVSAADRRLTRLDLARWLVSNDNPLTARVFVNRLWKLLFGQGLVRTTEDFGTQGAAPSHPELLDWLALEFIDSGWDVKQLIRLIVLSGTYMQSSHESAELRRVDPFNQFLARQGRFRLDAEMVRDGVLASSGLLTQKLGGRSVKPYQPEGYWDHCNTFQGKLVYDQDHGEDLYRRSLYSYWKRTFLHPALLAFDAPSREECTAERPRSNTPLQALVLLNDPTFVEAARVLAERVIREGGATAESRIRFTFRQAFGRDAQREELQLLSTMVDRHLEQYREDPKSADELIRIGEWPVPPDIGVPELAAWTSVTRVVLNLHEAITRD
jgi:hypothetical protein